jgi:hypothetical protein
MSVNPKLATLMRVIDDNQDKMTEGEYLEAMNALAALHREVQSAVQAPQAPQQQPAAPIPNGGRAAAPAADANRLFARQVLETMNGSVVELRAWERVIKSHPDPYYNRILAAQWMQIPYVERFRLVREAVEYLVNKTEIEHRTPEPSVCPFITRHAVGLWSVEDDGNKNWECVCGYIGKVKHWKKHEQSERHQEWATHRTVSRRKIQKMKAVIHDDEAGSFIPFAKSNSVSNPERLYHGGIRMYTVWQDKNEWTHPELYADIHRTPKPAADGSTTWFVHRREIWARAYVQ